MKWIAAAMVMLAACGKDAKPEPRAVVPDASPPSRRSSGTREDVAVGYVELLTQRRWDEAIAMLGGGLSSRSPGFGDAWTQSWDQLFAPVRDSIQSIAAVSASEHAVVVRVSHARGAIDVTISVDGVSLVASALRLLYEPPAYVDPAAFHDEPIVIGGAGALSLPTGAGPFHAVVLVAGLDAADQDLQRGTPLHSVVPFRDLAWGLASRGIVVLRVEPSAVRATIDQSRLRHVTDQLALLASRPEIDRVFVLGLGDGGWLVPWIVRDNPTLAGGIIAAASSRPPVDRLPDKDQAARDYDAAKVARALDRPLLVIHAERAPRSEGKEWKRQLGKGSTVTTYPALDELLIAGTGPAPRYFRDDVDGHVDAAVIEDIVAWLKAH